MAVEGSGIVDRQLIKEHYNQHVNEGISTREALQRRREGLAAPLKQFHNEIKRRLIYRFAYRADALLDYASGRGGDLHKWKSAQIKYVKGYDHADREVEEARRRYGELRVKDPGCQLDALFEQTDNLGVQLVGEDRQYDVATCMFALHYFLDKEATLLTLMETISNCLKPGGYFVGTVPDGKRVKAHLVKEGGELKQGALLLKQQWQGKDAPFGSAYIMSVSDTVVEGHEGFTEGSSEYLTFEKVLLGVAKKFGLYPVTIYADSELDKLFEERDQDKAMKHFKPQYSSDADPGLHVASTLYMAFVFQKVDKAEDAHAPPLPPPDITTRPLRQQQQQRPRRQSPTREERFGRLQEPEQQQKQLPQQQDNAQAWRTGSRYNKMDNWQLPYLARHLPPEQMPSAFYNVVKPEHLNKRAAAGRFVIKPPPLPPWAGPVQWYEGMGPTCNYTPDGEPINSYYVELNYHERQQQQQQQQQQGGLLGAGLPSAVQQQQQRPPPHGPGAAAAAGTPAGRLGPPQQQHQARNEPQLQQQRQQAAYPPPPRQQQDDAAAAVADGSDGGTRGRGRGRSRGRGRKAAAAAEEGVGEGELASPSTGRARGGRGSRGGRTTGSKRARASTETGEAAAAEADDGAAAAGAGADGADAEQAAPVAEGGDADVEQQHAAKRPALQRAGSGSKAAGAAVTAAGRKPAGGSMFRAPANDPLGYKSEVATDLSALPAEQLEQMAAAAPKYVEA